jgi:hypothetical protein
VTESTPSGEYEAIDDASKYVQDSDRVDQLLRQTHETTGMIKLLFDQLAEHIDELQSEIRPQQKGGQ